jgi:formylglycine-generating enzyme required for sulfatase activity
MVRIDLGSSTYCIDATEVTRKQYASFLDAALSTSDQPPICAWNTSYLPPQGTVDMTDEAAPMVFVDWCDALAFCTWAGKRLCGSIQDGGPLATADGVSPTKSEWMAACSRNGTRPYSYGQTTHPDICNSAGDAAAHVGSFTGCQGGYDGIYDMLGNVTEWVNECDDRQPDGGGKCNDRGGSYVSTFDHPCQESSTDIFSNPSGDWGFRCCAAPQDR